MELDAKIPEAPIEDMWSTHKEHMRLVGPRNRPQYKVIVVKKKEGVQGVLFPSRNDG